MTELHEHTFKWPAGPSKVIVTGSFDRWSCTTELSKGDDGFIATFHLPWNAKVTYKYIVDGQWKTNPIEPREPDEAGNINNVYTSPPKPPVIPQEYKESSPEAPVAAVVAPSAPVAEKTSMEGAKDTAASVVSYMASGLGAAFASVTGIDPINPQQIPLDDEKAKKVLETIPVSAPDAKKAEPAPTIGTAHDPLVPEAPIAAKPIFDALAPIIDEPVVLNLLPAAAASTITNTTTTVTEQATATSKSTFAAATSYLPSTAQISAAVSSAVAAVTDKLPSTSAATATATAVDKVQETVAPATSVPIPDAPEPYKEAPTTDPIPISDAPEPYKATANGTLPGELEAAPKKVEEAVEKVKEETASTSGALPTQATEAVEKVKEAVGGATDTVKGTIKSTTTGKSTPPASPTKKGFPGSDGTAGSITSSSAAPGDGTMTTPKRKKRHSIFGKLKEALTPDKKKKERFASTSS